MAQLIEPNPSGDTSKVIEDKTRALPANQGLNDNEMWIKIDAEIAAAKEAGTIKGGDAYTPINKHGNK